MAKTERAAYRATVKEGNSGVPFLMFEPMAGNLPFLSDAFVALELRPGTTLDEAQELARQLHLRVEGLAITRLK